MAFPHRLKRRGGRKLGERRRRSIRKCMVGHHYHCFGVDANKDQRGLKGTPNAMCPLSWTRRTLCNFLAC